MKNSMKITPALRKFLVRLRSSIGLTARFMANLMVAIGGAVAVTLTNGKILPSIGICCILAAFFTAAQIWADVPNKEHTPPTPPVK
jgi:hypothetical protein